jgi:hypothetical protein
MVILYIVIAFLTISVLLLAMALYYLIKKSTYLSEKEKEFITFVIDIFVEYGDDLGIQSKDEHQKISKELEKIKNKHLRR